MMVVPAVLPVAAPHDVVMMVVMPVPVPMPSVGFGATAGRESANDER